MGYNRFYDIVERYGLKVRRRRRRVRTTDSDHGYPVYPDLVKSWIPARPADSQRHYLYTLLDAAGNGRERLLLSLPGDGLLHEGDHRL